MATNTRANGADERPTISDLLNSRNSKTRQNKELRRSSFDVITPTPHYAAKHPELKSKNSSCNSMKNGVGSSRKSIDYIAPSPVDGVMNPELKSKKQGLFGNIHLRSPFDSSKHEKLEADIRGETQLELAEKDKTIIRLLFQLQQRETAIRDLEEIVLLQQESIELHRKSSEQEPKNVLKELHSKSSEQRPENVQVKRTTVEEEDKRQEAVDQLNKQLKEAHRTNASLTVTVKTQKEELEVMREQVSNSMEGKEETIKEMKSILQELQAKLLDKNNTNSALVRSARMQSETIASLRKEQKTLQQQKAQWTQDSAEERRQQDEMIGQLRRELVTISKAFHARAEEQLGDDSDEDENYSKSSRSNTNPIFSVVPEEGSEMSLNTTH